MSLLVLGCGAAPEVERADQPTATQDPIVEELSPESFFGGVETCFNGLDDNGNRLIDEGCGVAQSEVQFVAAWDNPDADIDLYARDPDGEIATSDGTTNLGLTLSADCPRQKKLCHGQNYENAYLEESELAAGKYRLRLRLEEMPAEQRSIRATLGVRLPGRTLAHRVEFFGEGQEVLLEFEVQAPQKKTKKAEKKE